MSGMVFLMLGMVFLMSGMVFLMTLRRMQLEVTAHGFRSSFRDWASEKTSFPREVCEQALAHAVGDKVEAAYRRGDLFENRRHLMDAWTLFCAGPNRRYQPGLTAREAWAMRPPETSKRA